MISSYVQKKGLAAATFGFLCAVTVQLNAQQVVYTAVGTFASPPISGNDLFQLRNEPFSIAICGSESATPVKTFGTPPTAAQYGSLEFVGTVTSGLIGTPIGLGPQNNTSIILATGNPTIDLMDIGTGFKILNLPIGIKSQVAAKKGTLSGIQILPFTHGVQLCGNTVAPCTAVNASLTYSDPSTGQSTMLGMNGILLGTAATTCPTTPPAVAAGAVLMLHSGGAEAISTYPDGTKSVRPVSGGVDLGGPSDSVSLRLYATGVRHATDVRVMIGGEEVPVHYAGPSGHYDGLDEVIAQLPHTLAGRGEVDVVLRVDGRSANVVSINIR